MERIAKLENERTKKVLKEIEETDLDSEDLKDVELRKTKNEEYFYEKIIQPFDGTDVLSSNNAADQSLSEYKFNDNTHTLNTESNPSEYEISKTTTEVKKILILDNNVDCSLDNQYSNQSDVNIHNQLNNHKNN